VAKRLIDIEDALLEQARQALGTSTLKEIVRVALLQAVRSSQRRTRLDDAALQFATAAEDLGDPRVMGAAWQ
jgi:Arc/MetJ family transcription regulator